jgi:hypothetical protein
MSDITEATWTAYVHGKPVQLPATIDGIRAKLPSDRREAFEAEIGKTPGAELEQKLGLWALKTCPGAVEEMDDTVARLRAGDFSGVTFLDDDQGEAVA